MSHQRRQFQVWAQGECQVVEPSQVMDTLKGWRAQGIPARVKVTNTRIVQQQVRQQKVVRRK